MINSFIMYIFLLLSLSFANDIFLNNSELQKIESGPFLSYDHINNTSFNFNCYNPFYLNDLQILDINVNSATYNPHGSFKFTQLHKDFETDSLISNGFEHKRGDYGYYENAIFINNKQQDVSSFLLLHSRSQPRYYAQSSRGISLQNYLFNISKENEIDKLSKISMTFLYHKEDIYFPLSSNKFISRYNESYNLGLSSIFNFKRLSINAEYSNQFTNGNHFKNNEVDELNQWSNILCKLKLNKRNFLHLDFKYKGSDLEMGNNNYYDEYIDTKIFLTYYHKNSLFSFGYNHLFLNNNIFDKYYINISYKNIDESITLGYNSEFINQFTYYDLNELSNNSILHKVSLKLSRKENYINFEPFLIQFKNDLYNINGTLLNGRYTKDNLHLSFYSGLYLSDKEYFNPINKYLNYSLSYLIPGLSSRYKPFITFSGNFLDVNNSQFIDFFTENNNDFNSRNNILNNLNLKLGFVLNRFTIGFNYMNVLDNKHIYRFDQNSTSLGQFFGLDINWRFLD